MCKHLCITEHKSNGNSLQYSCLENPMDGGAWWAAVHGVRKSCTWLSDFTFTFHFHALEKELATHSSALAWRIPGMGEPGGLPSMGSHRVRHDWSDLAAEHKSSVRLFLVVMESQHKMFKQKSRDHISSYNSTIGGGDGYFSCGRLALSAPNLIEMSTSFLMAVVKLLRKTIQPAWVMCPPGIGERDTLISDHVHTWTLLDKVDFYGKLEI